MKTLPQNTSSSNWDNRLLEYLTFIKKHKRYPFRRRTLMPVFASIILIGFIVRLALAWFLTKDTDSHQTLFFIIFMLIVVPLIVAVRRFWDMTHFLEAPTPFFVAENMKLLDQFLKEQRLVTFRHPEAPEIFQIISRNISALGDEREVMIYIADDKRILVNSHFTNSRKWHRIFSAPTHHHQMTRQLREWLKARSSQNSGLTKPGS